MAPAQQTVEEPIEKKAESVVITTDNNQQRLVYQMVAELKSARDHIEILSKAYQESREDIEMLKRELRQQQQPSPASQHQDRLQQEVEKGQLFQFKNEASDVLEIHPSTVIQLLVGPAPQYPPAQIFTGGLNNQQRFLSLSQLMDYLILSFNNNNSLHTKRTKPSTFRTINREVGLLIHNKELRRKRNHLLTHLCSNLLSLLHLK